MLKVLADDVGLFYQRRYGNRFASAASDRSSLGAVLNTAAALTNSGGCRPTHSWLDSFRRVRIRFDRRSDIHEAFLKLACTLVCCNIVAFLNRAY